MKKPERSYLSGLCRPVSRLRFALAALFIVAIALPCSLAWTQSPQPTPRVAYVQDEAVPEGAAKARKGVSLKLPLADDPSKRITGKVLWFTVDEVTYTDDEGNEAKTSWADFDQKRLEPFLSSLPDRKDVDSLLTAAEVMIGLGMQEQRIEHLFKSALRVDEDASDRIDALRAKMEDGGGEPADEPDTGDEPADGTDEPGGIDDEPNANPRAWPKLSEEQHAAAVKALQEQADEVLAKMNHRMGSTQTERFLVYSDMPKKESKYWVGLLDKMYDKLCGVFDLDEEINIWKGKCLLLFFNDERDYLKYNGAAYGNNAQGSAGICYQFGNGDVHILMYKQRDEKDLAHVLVHEAVHGFLFRYQSSHYVPNWLNEGLAEFIAVSLVDSGEYPGRAKDARQFVKQRGGLDNFLSARNIIGQHYGLAFDVTSMMVAENRKGYVKMIQGIKEGKSASQAFDDDYGASIDKVFQYYAKTRLKMDGIKVNVPN